MTAYLLYALAALTLGVLTSLSPCPMATNIAAVSYVGRKVGRPKSVLAAGGLYTLGRCLLYMALAVLLTGTATSSQDVSLFLQKHMHLALGPVFLLLGMFLVGFIQATTGGAVMTEAIQRRIDALGIWGALPLGMLFAVSFCPPSAAWFLGMVALLLGKEAGAVTSRLARLGIVLPDAHLPGGTLVLSLIYGIGTAVPVLVVAFLLAYSARWVGTTYHVLARIEWWTRQLAGWIFLALGAWFSLRFLLAGL